MIRFIKNWRFFAVVLIIAVFSLISVIATTETHGEISFVICTPFEVSGRGSELGELIQTAQMLQRTTRRAESGDNTPSNQFWATPLSHEIFLNAISEAQTFYDMHKSAIGGAFVHGDEFEITVRANTRTNIASTMLRITIPSGLELVGFKSHVNFADEEAVFVTPEGWNENNNTIYPPITDYAFAGWTNADIPLKGDLFTYTFRIAETAAIGLTQPIKLDFANAFNYQPSFDAKGNPFNINYPNELSRIIVVDDARNNVIEVLAQGEEFTVTLPLYSSENIAAAMVKVGIPTGIELIGFQSHINIGGENCDGFFVVMEGWDNEMGIINPPINGSAFAGWTNADVELNGNLFAYTFRISENVDFIISEPITFAFANAFNFQPPISVSEKPVEINLPGTPSSSDSRIWEFGRVIIKN